MKAYFNLFNIASYKAQQLATSFAKKKKKKYKKFPPCVILCSQKTTHSSQFRIYP